MQSGVDAPTDPGADPSLLLDKSQSYLIWRQDLDVRFREQADDEAHALTLVGQGATFEALCDGLCDWIDAEHVPIRAASLLKTWIFEGLLATVTIEA